MEALDKLLSIDPNYVLIGLITFFFSAEVISKRPAYMGKKLKHLAVGFLFQLMAIALASLIGLIIITVSDWVSRNELGLFNWIPVPLWFKIIVGFLIFDMSDYLLHRLDHTVPLFWRFHRIHHSDTMMDATTALRVYPTEGIYFLMGEMFFMITLGLPVISLNLYLFTLLPVMFLQHSNIRYPKWIDGVFGWIFVTPNLHKVHHDVDQHYTDSNYGTVFILWDKLFGTFRRKALEEVKYGLNEFEEDHKQSFLYLLRSPFLNIVRGPDNTKNKEAK